jgi:hypothetical protein
LAIVEERIYTLYPGRLPAYLQLYEEEGLAIQRPILGELVGYFSTEIGPLNQIVHLWRYQDLGDRAARRAALQSNPAWRTYVAKVQPMIREQENKILIPAPFSPFK